MKNKIKLLVIFSVFIILCASAFTLTGCKGRENESGNGSSESSSVSTPTSTSENTNSLELTKNAVQLVYGESAVVVAKYKDEDGVTLVWKSSDESVATVENGIISSTGLGTATVTATYGELKAECSVSVTYGDSQPILTVDHLGDELNLLKGDAYSLASRVTFNGKSYNCGLSAEIADNTVAVFENGEIKALKKGETEVTLKGNWNNFDTPLMRKSFLLKVTENDLIMYMSVERKGEAEVTDDITLSVTDSFEGKTYINEAIVKFVVKENGVDKTGSLTLASGENVIDFAGNTIKAKGIGEAVIAAEYTNADGEVYTKELRVIVDCPVVTYDKHVEWTDDTLKNVLNYFESGAVILAAKQGSKELQHTKRMLTGVVFNGDNTEPIEVQTSKGGYIFEDIFGCNVLLTEDNFVSTLTLGTGVKNKYYALGGNIGSAGSPMDMADQKNATDTSNFAGVFDGRGHTVYAATYDNGIFGGYGYDAVVKNAEFVITFKSSAACGITSDKGRWMKNPKMRATIENVRIITTNFGEKNHVISSFKPELLKMKNVLVEVNGAETVADFDGREGVGVLFETDISYYDFMLADAGLECFDNVRVVVNKFLPMSNGKVWNGSTFVTFALNDEKEFGKIERVSESRDTAHYCVVKGVERHGDWLRDVIYASDKTQPDGYQHLDCIMFCYALKKMENGGIYRYNTTEDLKKAGVNQVGDWIVG